MKKTFTTCDRCGANINCEPKILEEIEVCFITEETGAQTMKEVELCNDCYNALVKFFGQPNPFTGAYFNKK